MFLSEHRLSLWIRNLARTQPDTLIVRGWLMTPGR